MRGTLSELLLMLNTLERKQLLQQSEAAYARRLLLSSRPHLFSGAQGPDAQAQSPSQQAATPVMQMTPGQEVKFLKAVYGDACVACALDPEDQLAGLSHALRLVLRASSDPDGVWISVLFKFPEEYPDTPALVQVVDSSGVTTGDLTMLEFMMHSKVWHCGWQGSQGEGRKSGLETWRYKERVS